MNRKNQVLVVDDEEPMLQVIREALESCGYAVDTVSNCRDALSSVRNTPYELVILDLLLPDMNGFVLSQEISRIRPRLKERILFISAVLFGQNTVDHLNAMGAGFLPKPFDTSSLVQAVNRISGSASAQTTA
jgi:DNA-binding response OmpR family regulator